MKYAFVAASLASAVYAQGGAYAQCGGVGWTGATTCVSGYTCTFNNEYYSQCLPGSGSGASSGNGGATATATPTTLATATSTGAGSTVTNADNPLAGYSFYANPHYASEINNLAIPTLKANGKDALAAKASGVANVGTFYWIDVRAKVPTIGTYAAEVKAKNAAGANLALPIVVYDLPDRDCSALASNGELSIANNGSALYKEYIDNVAAQVNAYPEVKFVIVLEPDSLANLVTNLNVAKCANAAQTYKDLTVYALQKLNLENVVLYLDGGHAGWLGWPANISPAAQVFAEVYKAAGKPAAVRGLVTNVSNYNAWNSTSCPSYTTPNANCDEQKFHNAFAPVLREQGFPAHFLVDTGRSGVQPTKQTAWGNWCNVAGAGFGIRPSTATNDPLLDAWVWVKPGGEADGTSDSSSSRYDSHCSSSDALQPAPEAGTWFQAYFEQLLENANPSF